MESVNMTIPGKIAQVNTLVPRRLYLINNQIKVQEIIKLLETESDYRCSGVIC